MLNKQFRKNISIGLSLVSLAGCSHNADSFSLLAASQTFSQSAATVNNKVDILWVVDNSQSMLPLQSNLVKNFGTFISTFQAKGFDFRIAVTTSDAYRANPNFNNDPSLSVFRDGVGSTHTGVTVVTPSTPDLVNTFVTNASQGQTGSGDERVFSSFSAALTNSQNANFVRPDSFFAVIILSDEDDFSDPNRQEGSWQSPGGIPDHDYNDPGLESVDSYISFLDNFTNSVAANRRYSVSAITVPDQNCYNTHVKNAPSTIIGQRYIDMVNKTNGVLGSICDASYANSLSSIQQKILELSTQFPLARTPVVSSIKVSVDGNLISQDPTNGWTYEATSNSIMFHGTAVPSASSAIQVSFDPAGVKN
ncbi:MAG: hypothetical protein ACXWRE_05800 [Pseudobdellovibrionaceae bacterium]